MEKKLQGKDLMNVGIYTAIYFFVTFLVAMLGFIPIFMVLIYKAGQYKSAKSAVLAAGIFPLWMWGNYLPLFFNPDQYFASRQSFGQGYVDSLTSMLPTWMCPVLLIFCFLSGMAGGLFGKKMLKKHFKKAGIA